MTPEGRRETTRRFEPRSSTPGSRWRRCESFASPRRGMPRPKRWRYDWARFEASSSRLRGNQRFNIASMCVECVRFDDTSSMVASEGNTPQLSFHTKINNIG